MRYDIVYDVVYDIVCFFIVTGGQQNGLYVSLMTNYALLIAFPPFARKLHD